MTQNLYIFFATTTMVVILDLATKTFWFSHATMWTSFAPFLQTTQHKNYGLIANLPMPQWIIIASSITVLLSVLLHFRHRLTTHWPMALSLGLLTGGALGNIYDRLALGFARDWLLLFNTSALNIADITIMTGIIHLLASMCSRKTQG